MTRMSKTVLLVYIGSLLVFLGWQSCANQTTDDDWRRSHSGYAGGGYYPVVGGRGSFGSGRAGGGVASHSGGFGNTGHAVGS